MKVGDFVKHRRREWYALVVGNSSASTGRGVDIYWCDTGEIDWILEDNITRFDSINGDLLEVVSEC